MQPLEPDKIYKLTQVLTSNRRELFLLLYNELLLALNRARASLDQERARDFWDSAARIQSLLDELTRSVDARFADVNVDLFKLHQYYFRRMNEHIEAHEFQSPGLRYDLAEMRKTFTLLRDLFAAHK